MDQPLRIAVTADLHWGHGGAGEEATRLLVSFLHEHPPDVFLLAGDIGTGQFFADCLRLFADLPCRKALVPGNHDLWVRPEDERDSLQVYEEDLAALARQHGFHYLDRGPLLLPEAGLGIAGSINWYDYSWSLEMLQRDYPEEEERLQSKRFTRGRHNDAIFVRWPLDDVRFTALAVEAFERQLREMLNHVERAIVVAHHPPLRGLSFPEQPPPLSLDRLLWDAFGGNAAMEEVLARHAERIDFVFCGHTHRERDCIWHGIRGYNIGGDYHFKRLLWLDWPSKEVTSHSFGNAIRQDH